MRHVSSIIDKRNVVDSPIDEPVFRIDFLPGKLREEAQFVVIRLKKISISFDLFLPCYNVSVAAGDRPRTVLT